MIEVEFPDGTIRKVPSIERIEESRERGGPQEPRIVKEPAFDPDWEFTPTIGGKWRAHERRRL